MKGGLAQLRSVVAEIGLLRTSRLGANAESSRESRSPNHQILHFSIDHHHHHQRLFVNILIIKFETESNIDLGLKRFKG